MITHSMPHAGRRLSRANGGFSLIEVLVAVLVLSLGLLGFAATLGVSVRSNQSANFRTQATNLAYEILDRIRANSPNALGYAMSPTSATTSISGTSQARRDVQTWMGNVRRALGDDATAEITVAAGVVTVNLAWTDQRQESASSAQVTTFTVQTQL